MTHLDTHTLLAAYMLTTFASGAHGALLAWREGRFAPTPALGGIPVELRARDAGASSLSDVRVRAHLAVRGDRHGSLRS